MMSNSRRSSPVINAHLPVDQAGGRYCFDRREFEIMTVIGSSWHHARVGPYKEWHTYWKINVHIQDRSRRLVCGWHSSFSELLSNKKPQNHVFSKEVIHENDAEESYKYALATQNSSYPSPEIHCSRFQSPDTIPLKHRGWGGGSTVTQKSRPFTAPEREGGGRWKE